MTFRKYLTHILLIAASIVSLTSCSSDDNKPFSRTVLVYMVANNNLGVNGFDNDDISEMETAVAAGALGNGRLLVYRGLGKDSRLIELTPQGQKILATYTDDLTSVDKARMARVFNDMRMMAPADDYGLILWSHGTGWRSGGNSRSSSLPDQQGISPLSFGLDGSAEMKVTSLRVALESTPFSFVYFDCCFMMCAEVCYELRNVTGILAGSPTELPAAGMPYDRNLKYFFSREPQIVQAAMSTYDYYATNSKSPGCSMVVVETSAMETLAQATRDILASGVVLGEGYQPVKFYASTSPVRLYDMAGYVRALHASSELQNRWESAFSQAQKYSAATARYNNIDLTYYNGLGCYIVRQASDANLDGYTELAWWKDVASKYTSL